MIDLTNEEWRNQIQQDASYVILDVRTDDEYNESRIPGAVQANVMNPPEFMERIQQMDKNKSYYVYCKSGGRSVQACAVLEYLGFQKIYNLEGGITEWDGEIE